MIIYKTTNLINGKIYIGQTSQILSERIGDHRRKSQVHNSRSHFHSAIRKYGFEVFKWEIIDNADTRIESNEKERNWISIFGTANPMIGYNNTTGGDSFEFTDESKRKIGESGRGIRRSQKFKDHLRKIFTGSGNPFYGKHHTEEAKRKNRDAHLGKKLTPEHIAKCIHRGSSNSKTKINEEIARRIKVMLKHGTRKCIIQKELGVSKAIVAAIWKGTTWRHVSI
jgi:group I intron endonuclease